MKNTTKPLSSFLGGRFILLALGLCVSAGVQAHPLHTMADFYTGLAHPWSGVDHWLVMFAIGVLAARQKGFQRMGPPALFLLSMLVGTLWHSGGNILIGYELGVLVSMGLIGAGLLLPRLPLILGCAAAGLGFFHGYAHHVEIGNAAWGAYVAGFMGATAVLHGLGYGVIRFFPQYAGSIQRLTGFALLVSGALLSSA